MDKGGFINIHACEAIMSDNDPVSPTAYYMFDCGSNITDHYNASIGLSIRDARVEHRTDLCRMIHSGWRFSKIHIDGYGPAGLGSDAVPAAA